MKIEKFINELELLLSDRFSISKSTRSNYAKGEDIYDPVLSRAVVFPKTTDEVSKIIKICNTYSIPMIPFGTGTSLEGHVLGNEEGITISLAEATKVRSYLFSLWKLIKSW